MQITFRIYELNFFKNLIRHAVGDIGLIQRSHDKKESSLRCRAETIRILKTGNATRTKLTTWVTEHHRGIVESCAIVESFNKYFFFSSFDKQLSRQFLPRADVESKLHRRWYLLHVSRQLTEQPQRFSQNCGATSAVVHGFNAVDEEQHKKNVQNLKLNQCSINNPLSIDRCNFE